MTDKEPLVNPRITGQVIQEMHPDRVTHTGSHVGAIQWWITEWTLPDGNKVYERSIISPDKGW